MTEESAKKNLDDLRRELLEAKESLEIDDFRRDLLEATHVRASESSDADDLDFAFVCEVGERLSNAEEFQDFIPCHGNGVGHRRRKLRVDGYEIDEADDSIRLLIADFKGEDELETKTKARISSVFAQLRAFVEESSSGSIWSSDLGKSIQTRELSASIEQLHTQKPDGSRSVSRYRFYLITDGVLSDRVGDFEIDELDGVPIEYHIWDLKRLKTVASSSLGIEELEIDFTEFADEGLPCISASRTEDYESYLAVINGDALVKIFDRYGSRLLEGNVRSFLNTSVRTNKGIQKTIRAEPDKFFVYNNGISATATSAEVSKTINGLRLRSVKYLQIVNGGQTTASLHVAKRKDNADLSMIQVPMKLSVVLADDAEKLDEMIQSIARYSNSQNKVSDVDFFSNHAFHRAIERRSRSIPAPRQPSSTFNTFWFYERARGQYVNAQSKMTIREKKVFQRDNPRAQLISKTDLAKFENSWRKLPHIVSRAAQKNFLNFAEYIDKNYGANGDKFDNDLYFKEIIAKAIIFRFVEKLVSAAKSTWYGGDYRAQIVTYTIAKFVSMIEEQADDLVINLNLIWARQGVSIALSEQLEVIAKSVSVAVTTPPAQNMNVGEWCKKEDCWNKVKLLPIILSRNIQSELLQKVEACHFQKDAISDARENSVINAVINVVQLRNEGCWNRLNKWTIMYSPIAGKEADLVRLASNNNWIPSDKQAAILMRLLNRLEQEGFNRDVNT